MVFAQVKVKRFIGKDKDFLIKFDDNMTEAKMDALIEDLFEDNEAKRIEFHPIDGKPVSLRTWNITAIEYALLDVDLEINRIEEV